MKGKKSVEIGKMFCEEYERVSKGVYRVYTEGCRGSQTVLGHMDMISTCITQR